MAQGHLGTWDIHLNKLGKGPLGNATYQMCSMCLANMVGI